MSTMFGDEVRGQSQDENEGIINKPGMEQTYAGVQVSALKDNSIIPVDERQGLFELGSTLSKPFGKLLDDISTDNQDHRAIEAAGRQGMSTAMNQIDQDKKRFGLAEAWGGQSVEYRTAQLIAVENTFEKMHLDDLDTIDQYAELTPQQFLDHRTKLLREYTAPWKDDKEALLKITDKFINNTRTLVTMQAKEHKAVTEKAIDDGLAERLHVGYAVQTKEVEAARGNPEKLKSIHENIVKLMTYDPEVSEKEGVSEDRFNAAVMHSTVSELEIGNPGPMRGLMQLIKQKPKMMDSKLGKVAMSKVRTAKNAWYADKLGDLNIQIGDLKELAESNPMKAMAVIDRNDLRHFAEGVNMWDGDGERLVNRANMVTGQLHGKAFDEHMKERALGTYTEAAAVKIAEKEFQATKGLTKKGMRYTDLIQQEADDNRIDPNFVASIIQAESSFNPEAKSTFKPKSGKLKGQTQHAYGLMQLYRPDRPGFTGGTEEENVAEGTKQLAEELKFFKGDMRLAAAAYNAGRNAVIKYNNNVPPYPDTQKYVQHVMSIYDSKKGSEKTSDTYAPRNSMEAAKMAKADAQAALVTENAKLLDAKKKQEGELDAVKNVREALENAVYAETLTETDMDMYNKQIAELQPVTQAGVNAAISADARLVALRTKLRKGVATQKADINTHNSIEMRRAQQVNKEHVGPSMEGNLTGKEMDLQNDFTAAMAVNRIEARGDGRKLEYAWLSPGKTVDIAGTVGKLVADPVLALKYAQKLDKIGIPPGGKNEVAKAYAMAQIGGVHNMVDKDFRLSPEGKENFTVMAEMLHEKDSSKSTFTAKEFAMLSYVTREVLSGADPRTVMKEWGKIAASPATQKEITDATGTEIKGVTTREQLVEMFHHGLGGDPDKMFPESAGEYPVEFGEFVQNYNWLMRAGYDDKDAVDHAKKMLIGQQAVVNGRIVYGSKDIKDLIVDGHSYSLENVLNGSKGLQQVWLAAAGTMQDTYGRKLKDMKPRALGYDPITELLFVEFAGKTQKVNKRALMEFAKQYHGEYQVEKEAKQQQKALYLGDKWPKVLPESWNKLIE